MKKIIRLTESDLVRLVKRVINEQQEDFRKKLEEKGYVLDNNLQSGKLSDIVNKLKKDTGMTNYYYNNKNGVQMVTDGKKVVFIVAPKNIRELGPYEFESIESYL
jgi:hypothetical protein